MVGTALQGSTALARVEQHALSVQVRNGHPLAPHDYSPSLAAEPAVPQIRLICWHVRIEWPLSPHLPRVRTADFCFDNLSSSRFFESPAGSAHRHARG
jgi:hypothetical protein